MAAVRHISDETGLFGAERSTDLRIPHRMTLPLAISLTIVAGYLAGSIPFGYLTARFVAGIDIRSEGSGNIGATNIARVLGAKWGLLVLGLDCLKGLLPVLLAPALLFADQSDFLLHGKVLCGIATIVGHMLPVWLRFRGGKGVATALGVALALGSWATLAAFGGFVVAMLLFRIVALASLTAAVVFAVVQIIGLLPDPFSESKWSVAAFSLLVPALIVVRHRTNIARMLRGEEKRFRWGSGKKRDQIAAESPVADTVSEP